MVAIGIRLDIYLNFEETNTQSYSFAVTKIILMVMGARYGIITYQGRKLDLMERGSLGRRRRVPRIRSEKDKTFVVYIVK